MADEGEKDHPVTDGEAAPTEREFFVLHAVRHFSDRIVLLPVRVNGQARFALGLLCQNTAGELYIRVLANLLQPSDEVLDTEGCPGYNKTPPVKKALN
jgi:hypothetical protein